MDGVQLQVTGYLPGNGLSGKRLSSQGTGKQQMGEVLCKCLYTISYINAKELFSASNHSLHNNGSAGNSFREVERNG